MQERHLNRQQYFEELAQTTEKYLIPYITEYFPLKEGMRVLELGCGDGGNLLPFAKMGCEVVGIDLNKERTEDAKKFFVQSNAKGDFYDADITKPLPMLTGKFDLILCHDVVEHIDNKQVIFSQITSLLNDDGYAMIAFPAWQMPFGGHQQICRSRILSHLPWIHLLPACCYRLLLKSFGEPKNCVDELLDIKRTRTSIEYFERTIASSELKIQHRLLWFINPHYETKFHLTPRRLSSFIAQIPYLRNFFTTSCFYLLKR